jgi:hypothetical protein
MLASDTRQVVNSVVIQQGFFVRNVTKSCCTINPTLILFIIYNSLNFIGIPANPKWRV